MAFIKTEPDSDGELFPASHTESHHIDIKEEVTSVLVSFPHMKTGSGVSCLHLCLLLIKCSSIDIVAVSSYPFIKFRHTYGYIDIC
jgi:hypothetical protein